MPGGSLEDEAFNTSCIGKDTLHQMTPGSITRTSVPSNYSNDIMILPRLDEWMYKNTPVHHQKPLSPTPPTMSDYSPSTSIYDYPSRAQSPWVQHDTPHPENATYVPSRTPSLNYPREMTTPELADTIVGMPMQLGIHTLQIERATIQASRAATIRILFDSRVREAVQTLHNDPGNFVHPNQDLLPNL